MRFMMLMIPAVYRGRTTAEQRPDAEAVKKMMAYNERPADAGALIALDGLHPPVTAARVAFGSGSPVVTDGPFIETTEAIGGYWIIRAGSREEAIEWARQVPAASGDVIEVRQIFDPEDHSAEVQEVAANSRVSETIARNQNKT